MVVTKPRPTQRSGGLWAMAVMTVFLMLSSVVRVQSDPIWNEVCTQEPIRSMPFCNVSLALEERVNDYVHRIPTIDKIFMMGHVAMGYEPLLIPPYQWWSEGLHGPLEPCVSFEDTCACPTSFPCPSALGAAFNATLYHAIGVAIGKEGRAISNLRTHDLSVGDGLTYWSPTINLQRDPRWGRNQEVPGEDPYLTSQYAMAFVQGLQGKGPTSKEGVGAACKHFVANSLEGRKGNPVNRHNFDAHVSVEDLNDYYLPPFRACTQHAMGTMCSYNALNGVPTCANDWLLKSTLRENWNFSGYVVSDCGALEDIYNGHHYAVDATQASAQALNATVDVNCGNGAVYPKGLLQAYQQGWVTEATIRNSFARLARIQFRLGLFDPKSFNPRSDIQKVGSHGDLALEAALQSIVLLQNRNNILPLNPNSKLAVIGPHMNAKSVLLGNYHGSKCGCGESKQDNFDCIPSPIIALGKLSQHPITGVMGCDVSGHGLNEIELATRMAKESDVTVLLVGLNQREEREGYDRNQTTLPTGLQQELIEAVLGVASDKTVLVLVHGGSVSLGASVLAQTPAILSASYGGEAASEALAQVLFGLYNPTGKLAATMYPPSFADELSLEEMSVRVGVGRTHLYYKGTPEFPFGHGLSYSQWELEWDNDDDDDDKEDGLGSQDSSLDLWFLPNEPQLSSSVRVGVVVRNKGPFVGGQTVLLFWRPTPSLTSTLDIRERLIGFQGITSLAIDEETRVEFEIHPHDFALWDRTQNATQTLPGAYTLEARASDSCVVRTLHLHHHQPPQQKQPPQPAAWSSSLRG